MHNPITILVTDAQGNVKYDQLNYNMRTSLGDNWMAAVCFGYSVTNGTTSALTALAVTSNSGFSPARSDTSFTGLTTNGFTASNNVTLSSGITRVTWTFSGATVTLYGAAAMAPFTSTTEQPMFEATFSPVITLATNDIVQLTWNFTIA